MIDISVSECCCDKCSSMCHSPCAGTPEDMIKLMDAGYGNRLSYDDLPGGEDMIKPSLKGYEGKKNPWETTTKRGCTFWKKGKCALHQLELKPTQGKLAHHSHGWKEVHQIEDYLNESWSNGKGDKAIKKWKEMNEK